MAKLNLTRRKGLALAACALATLVAGTARAATIAVNFVGGQSGGAGAATVTGTAGAVPQANWNNEAPFQQTTAVSIVDSTGTAAASLAYTTQNNWAASSTAPGGGTNADMMNGYLDNFQNAGSISVTGLGTAFTSGGYQVLVYQNTDSNGSFGFTATDNAGHTVTAYGQQTGGAGSNYPLAGTNGFVTSTSTDPAGPGSAANTVVLNGLTGSNVTITGLSGTTGDGRVRPNGFQIVPTPEPASLAVVGLGSLGLLARRRRHG